MGIYFERRFNRGLLEIGIHETIPYERNKTDVLAMINALQKNNELWELYTKSEEYTPLFLDQHKRFTYQFIKHRDVLRPMVSEFLVQNGLKIEYPEGKRFGVCLTHDFDFLYSPLLHNMWAIFKSITQLKVKNALNLALSNKMKKWSQLTKFESFMTLEEKYGAKSSFYLLAPDKDAEDFSYPINNLENELGNIVDRGWEVGLHVSREAYDSLGKIKEEKSRLERVLNKKLIGCRNHFLQFKVPNTWKLLSEACFKYDTTFGYADIVGFRNGMCHPFRPFDLDTNENINILEIPLTVMDTSLFEKYMNFDVRNALDIIKLLIDSVRKYNGVITILWHNTHLFGERLKLFERVLSYCQEKKAWITSGEEIYRFWSKNIDI